jgi:hypothetical protein
MAFTKKEWFRPELIVLARNKPEEAVLESCKFGEAIGPQRISGRLHCKHGFSFEDPLSPCLDINVS